MAPEPVETTPPIEVTSEPGRYAVVWSTYPDLAAAERAAGDLVERRLAACVAILPKIVSIYRWQGAVERADEAVLLAKTRAAVAETVMAALRATHPYEVPALLVLPVAAASAAYGAWIEAETDG
jgi:periplasmic divalent cation tolerance protein